MLACNISSLFYAKKCVGGCGCHLLPPPAEHPVVVLFTIDHSFYSVLRSKIRMSGTYLPSYLTFGAASVERQLSPTLMWQVRAIMIVRCFLPYSLSLYLRGRPFLWLLGIVYKHRDISHINY